MRALNALSAAVEQLFYPHTCAGCGTDNLDRSVSLCWYCLSQLPTTHFSVTPEHPVEKIFWGRLPVRMAHAAFYYGSGSLMQALIHQFKYKKNIDLGSQLARMTAAGLLPDPRFAVDALIPVPLHRERLRQRGFNQAAVVCKGMADYLQLPVIEGVLCRSGEKGSQTRLGRTARWQNMQETFYVKDAHRIRNKRLLLVDDVITTGATLEACGQTLLQVPGVALSIAALCVTLR